MPRFINAGSTVARKGRRASGMGYLVSTRRSGSKTWLTRTFRGRGALESALRYQAGRPYGSESRLVPAGTKS